MSCIFTSHKTVSEKAKSVLFLEMFCFKCFRYIKFLYVLLILTFPLKASADECSLSFTLNPASSSKSTQLAVLYETLINSNSDVFLKKSTKIEFSEENNWNVLINKKLWPDDFYLEKRVTEAFKFVEEGKLYLLLPNIEIEYIDYKDANNRIIPILRVTLLNKADKQLLDELVEEVLKKHKDQINLGTQGIVGTVICPRRDGSILGLTPEIVENKITLTDTKSIENAWISPIKFPSVLIDNDIQTISPDGLMVGDDRRRDVLKTSDINYNQGNSLYHPFIDGSLESSKVLSLCQLPPRQLGDADIWQHALNVLGVSIGNSATCQNRKVERLLAPGNSSGFISTLYLDKPNEYHGHDGLTFILPFSNWKISSENQNNIRNIIKEYQRFLISDGIAVVSAPQRRSDSPRDFPPYQLNPFDQRQWLSSSTISECNEYPACLGFYDLALTVAASLGNETKLFDEEKYILGSGVIWIAAPGKDILTASLNNNEFGQKIPEFSLASGSSSAAGVAGSVIAALRQAPFNIQIAWKALAIISSGVEIDEDGDKVRFGYLNEKAIDRIFRLAINKNLKDLVETGGNLREAKLRAKKYDPKVCPNANRKYGCIRLFESNIQYNKSLNPTAPLPQIIPFNYVLRLILEPSKYHGIDGAPMFTVVYLAALPPLENYRKTVYLPVIRRHVLLAPDISGVAPECNIQGKESDNSCIYEEGAEGIFGINLLKSSVYLSPLRGQD